MGDASDPVETTFCTNCKRHILQANFVIHDLHCQRYIYLCTKCNEPVNHKERDAHDEAKHVFVFCKNCHAQIEKFLLSEHLINSCPYRNLKCQICGIEIRATHISEHENYCGARTEKCVECGEYVMFKYKQLHIESNHTFMKLSDEVGPSPLWQNGRRTLGNFLPDFDSVTRKPQTQQKKKSGKNENKWRRARGSFEYVGKDDESVKESSVAEAKDENNFLKKSDRITDNVKEVKGSPDCVADCKVETQTLKKPLSCAAAGLQSVDDTRANSDLKDTRSCTKKGKGNLSRIDGIDFEKTVSKEVPGNGRKNESTNQVVNDVLIARAIDENAAVLSEFSFFDPLEKKNSLPEKNLSDNIHNGKLSKTVRKSRLYDLDDSSDDEFLLYSKSPENELNYDGLPCQFCGSLYSPYTLMSHQQMCELNKDLKLFPRKKKFGQGEKEDTITCVICSQTVPFSRYGTHQILHDTAAKN